MAGKGYERFITSKYPDKRIAIVTCMDTRLVGAAACRLWACATAMSRLSRMPVVPRNQLFDSTMRLPLVAVYELGVNEIMVIGHTGCGVQGMNAAEMLQLAASAA